MPSHPTVTRLWTRWRGVGKEDNSLSASGSVLLPRSSQAGFARRFVRNRLAVLGLVLIGLVLIMFFVLPVLVPFEPIKQDLGKSLNPPSWDHLLGNDFQGRDVLSRVIYGGQLSLIVGVMGVLLALLLGSLLGMIAGYEGGLADTVIMRLMDVMLAFPSMLLAIVVTAVLGVGLSVVAIAICVFQIPTFARLTRGMVLTTKEQEFVLSARAVGAHDWQIQLRHIWPNILGPIIVQGSLNCAWGILSVAWMSFLGFGAQPPTPELGAMVNDGREFLRRAPHVSTFPGLMITIIVLAINFVGDGLRDAFDIKMD